MHSAEVLVIVLLSFLTGCGVLIGNTRPVDENSNSYRISEISTDNPDWQLLTSKGAGDKTEADRTYRSKVTSSTIAITSACRERPLGSPTHEELHALSSGYFMGASDTTPRSERYFLMRGDSALETTFHGKIEKRETMVRSVVLRHKNCVYTLIYVSQPDTFANDESTFTRFVASLKLK